MAALGAFGGVAGDRPWESPHPSPQQNFLNHTAVAIQPPKKKTWFEEIQAEVNEWLAGVDK